MAVWSNQWENWQGKSFDTYMAETGQQGVLDSLRKQANNSYERARDQYNSQGWYGSGWGSPGYDQRRVQEESARELEKAKAKNAEFLGRVQGIPLAMKGLEEELGIPAAREAYGAAGQAFNQVSGQLRDIPGREQTFSKQVGISAPRLQQRIAAKTAEFQPTVESAARGLESAQMGLGNVLQNYQVRAENLIAPFQIEAGVLGAEIQGAFEVYKSNVKNSLDAMLAQWQNQTAIDVEQMRQASELAKAEKAITSGSFVDLGNNYALINPVTGEQIASFAKGLAPTRGGLSSAGSWSGA